MGVKLPFTFAAHGGFIFKKDLKRNQISLIFTNYINTPVYVYDTFFQKSYFNSIKFVLPKQCLLQKMMAYNTHIIKLWNSIPTLYYPRGTPSTIRNPSRESE